MSHKTSWRVTSMLLLAGVVSALQPGTAAGQGAPFETATGPGPTPMRPFGQFGGCSEEPAQFHRCALEKAKAFTPPRTPDGTPDFQGFWTRIVLRNMENLEEHPQSMDTSGNMSVIVDPADGRIPYRPSAAALRRTNFATYMNPMALCLPTGSPKIAYSPGINQIVQTPGSVVFLADYAHQYRVVPTDGRAHVGRNIRLFMGDSRGRWEGNTLVVDVTNLSDRTWLDAIGNFYSEAVHVVERWTMFDRDVLHVEATFDDPAVFTRPWTIAFGLRRNTEPDYELLESACVEGMSTNEGMRRRNGDRQIYRGVPVP